MPFVSGLEANFGNARTMMGAICLGLLLGCQPAEDTSFEQRSDFEADVGRSSDAGSTDQPGDVGRADHGSDDDVEDPTAPSEKDPGGCDLPVVPGHLYSMSAMPFGGTEPLSLCRYQRQVILIVNTAALCGFSYQYEELQNLQLRFGQRGFSVLGFLSDDFLEQGGTDEQIEACNDEFRITFPQFEFTRVAERGDQPLDPIFEWLTTQPGFSGPVSWNFNKFLVDKQGRLVGRWDQLISADSPEVVNAIESALYQVIEGGSSDR